MVDGLQVETIMGPREALVKLITNAQNASALLHRAGCNNMPERQLVLALTQALQKYDQNVEITRNPRGNREHG